MYFKRKAYDRLLEWKAKYSDKYAALLEGVKRVGKSTIAESFGQNEYKSYLLIDFSKTTDNIRSCFEDVGNLNMFFLRLQAETGVTLYEHESLIIFDEVQLFPQARQAIKHLAQELIITSCGITKFFIVHRIYLYLHLLRRNQNVFYIFLNRD